MCHPALENRMQNLFPKLKFKFALRQCDLPCPPPPPPSGQSSCCFSGEVDLEDKQVVVQSNLLLLPATVGSMVVALPPPTVGLRLSASLLAQRFFRRRRRLRSYLNYTLSGWTTPIDGAQLSCSYQPSGQSDKQAAYFVLSLHLVLLRV